FARRLIRLRVNVRRMTYSEGVPETAMPSPDIYAKCDFTRTGQHEPWFVVVIKVPKAKLEGLRQQRENIGLEDKVILGKFSGQVMTVLWPYPDSTFSNGCRLYPEG